MPQVIYKTSDGERVPGVTTVLGEWGSKTRALVHSAWKLGSEGKDYREEWGKKMDAGSLTHARCEAHIKGQPPPSTGGFPAEVVEVSDKTFGAFLAWLAGTKLELLASEIPLVSEKHRYGGCVDAVGTLDGAPVLLDFKSKTLYAEQIVQVAAYAALWDEHHPDVKITSCHILGLTEGFHHHQPPASALAAGLDLFLRLRDVYELKKAVKAA